MGEYRVEIGRVRCGLAFNCYSLTHSHRQHSSLRYMSNSSKLQKYKKEKETENSDNYRQTIDLKKQGATKR